MHLTAVMAALLRRPRPRWHPSYGTPPPEAQRQGQPTVVTVSDAKPYRKGSIDG
jgi:hypothetical protein